LKTGSRAKALWKMPYPSGTPVTFLQSPVEIAAII
jgi:hypothetical protein